MRMSDEERKQYDEAMIEYRKEENDQYDKDQALLTRIKECVDPEYFEDIEFELKKSENPSNYRIINSLVGSCQDEGNYQIWIEQTCSYFGDDYSGTECIKLPNGKYLMWDYWM